MKKLLQFKHWQLFLLLMGIPILFQFVIMNSMNNLIYVIVGFPIMMILMVTLMFSWLYTLGTHLYALLPQTVTMNLSRFKLFLVIPIGYIVFITIYFLCVTTGVLGNVNPWIFAIIVPLHLFSLFCILYCLYFNAKALKSIELQRPVEFGDFIGEFFLIWMFPIGVWIIQPRINKLFKDEV